MPFGGILSSAIGAGTSIIGGLIGGSAAKKAAAAQAAANQAAANRVDKATGGAVGSGFDAIAQSNSAINTGLNLANQEIASAGGQQASLYNNMVQPLQPYMDAGAYGLDKLQSTAGTFNFTPGDLQNDPGYQFQLQQGMKALSNQHAAAGLLQSGALLSDEQTYAQGLAGTSFQNAYNRALSTYNTNQQGYQSLANLGVTANNQNLSAAATYGGQVGNLAALQAGTNMQGAGMLSNTAMLGNEYIGNQTMQGAIAGSNFLVGAGNAQAAGTMGAANAWSGALGGVANAAQTYSLGRMLANPATSSGLSLDTSTAGVGNMWNWSPTP